MTTPISIPASVKLSPKARALVGARYVVILRGSPHLEHYREHGTSWADPVALTITGVTDSAIVQHFGRYGFRVQYPVTPALIVTCDDQQALEASGAKRMYRRAMDTNGGTQYRETSEYCIPLNPKLFSIAKVVDADTFRSVRAAKKRAEDADKLYRELRRAQNSELKEQLCAKLNVDPSDWDVSAEAGNTLGPVLTVRGPAARALLALLGIEHEHLT
jgi:hypothetical protein